MPDNNGLAQAARASAILGLLALLGCASAAVPGAMVPPVARDTIIAETSRLRGAVAVGAVEGGRDTNPLWTSQVSNQDFAQALRQSLATHALLASGGGAYRLDAALLELRQPIGGFDLEVKATVKYRLFRRADGALVWETVIANAHNAPFRAALFANERLRLANEGAVRANIRDFLSALIAEEARNPAAFGGARPAS
jgi:hypothetical protein